MNKQEIEKAITYWKEFKAEIPELKDSYPETEQMLSEQEVFVDTAIYCMEQQLTNGWIPVESRLPESETEVLIKTERGTITTAMYEDGTITDKDSCWNWTDIDFVYDEEKDINYIPEGWWEYRHFNPDDVYNNAVDEKVVEWRTI